MTRSLMLKTVYASHGDGPKPVIVDLGYLENQDARDHADALMAHGIAKSRFSIEGHNRLMVEIPQSKVPGVMEAFPIKEGSTYFGTTHHWAEEPTPSTGGAYPGGNHDT
ncbi:hypothetical protein [Shinella sp. DD12]|uniref:hypothetical protein n=1 Tax=Shinella sp. DD12 TaxID=1410620 RepID=UPI0003C54FE6|nr:hypothetical protein [Shinella sp. DD12]EYR81789.1 hypothetical protein SHLA_4c000800 [Shinella sp. DD12]